MTNEFIIEDLTLVPVPVWWQNPWLLVPAVLALAAAGYLLTRWWRGRSPAASVAPPEPPGPPPHLEALRLLARLRARHATMEAYDVAIECSDILRNYIEARFVLPIRYQTTREFLGAAQAAPELNPEARAQLGAFLQFFDSLKFARAAATGQQTLVAIEQTEAFVRRCVPPDREGRAGH